MVEKFIPERETTEDVKAQLAGQDGEERLVGASRFGQYTLGSRFRG